MTTNYGGIDEEYSNYDNSKIVIVPVPYDDTSTWVKGADQGPSAIIEASANMELYDIEMDNEVYLQGIFTDNFILEKESPEKMINAVEDRVREHLDKGKFMVVIGGEHSVSLGTIKAHAEKYQNLSVLQLDAHADLRDEYEGSKFNHACVMARVKETCPIVQVGIRSMDIFEKENMDEENIFFMKNIVKDKGWLEKVISRLNQNVYITIDLDVFDPSTMPSTGTPEPGGLCWWEVLGLLKKVVAEKNVVGFDVAELCPNQQNKGPDFLAAKLIYKLLSYRFNKA